LTVKKSEASASRSRAELALIGLDTATEDTAVCALAGGEVLFEAQVGLSDDGRPGHTTRLLEAVENAASSAGGWDGVDSIAVGVGPGSFTGLRVGIASARALGSSLGLSVRGVGTLDALAAGIAASDGGEGRARLPVLDARRGEVFAALYSAVGERLWEPWVGTPGELVERLGDLPEAPLAAGSGAIRFRDEFAVGTVEILDRADAAHRVRARHICDLAEAGATVEALAPLYLRRPDAERWRERDTANRN
jgi:tRNA threonylcarbamoyladenosine biosynthesis protein TsaB